MLWPFTTSAHGAGAFWLRFLSSDGESLIHFLACFSMKTTSWTGAIRAKLICVQGCQIGSFGAKKQKFCSFEKQLAPKFLFGYLATFWLFCNFFIPQIFLGEELTVVRVACPCHHKTRSGPPPYSCVMLKWAPKYICKEMRRCANGTRNLSHAVSIESVLLCTAF